MGKANTILAYAAGIVDGEGTISICRHANRRTSLGYSLELNVRVVNTNAWLLQWLKMQFGGSVSIRASKDPRRKDVWEWSLNPTRCVEFLELIKPFLQLKREQAEIGIRFQKARRHSRWKTEGELATEEAERILMRHHNKRGKVNV